MSECNMTVRLNKDTHSDQARNQFWGPHAMHLVLPDGLLENVRHGILLPCRRVLSGVRGAILGGKGQRRGFVICKSSWTITISSSTRLVIRGGPPDRSIKPSPICFAVSNAAELWNARLHTWDTSPDDDYLQKRRRTAVSCVHMLFWSWERQLAKYFCASFFEEIFALLLLKRCAIFV